jgi:peptidoglycan/LPS O-acetylase OafA/YrhL
VIGLAFVVVAMAASACAGIILYRLVERPLLQWMSGKKRGRAKPAIAPVLQQAKLPGSSR